MRSIRQIVKENAGFLAVWFAFVAVSACFVFAMPKLALHLNMNAWHPALGDALFPYITKLAEGGLAAIVILGLLFVRVRDALYVGITHGITALTVQLLKRTVFSDHYRPSHFLDQMQNLPLVEGIEMHARFSFPSGHSAAIFSLCFAFAVVLRNKRWGWLLALLALLVGLSRIYLSQHFLQDVIAGSTVGILVPIVLYPVLMSEQLCTRFPWLKRNLRKLRE